MACVYQVDRCVRGYHVYQDTWSPLVGEELDCKRQKENIHDYYAFSGCKERECQGWPRAKKSFFHDRIVGFLDIICC